MTSENQDSSPAGSGDGSPGNKDLEARVTYLEQLLATRVRNLWLGIAVSFGVFAGLLVIHWAGHVSRIAE